MRDKRTMDELSNTEIGPHKLDRDSAGNRDMNMIGSI